MAALGLDDHEDLAAVAERCALLRAERGLPAALWTADRVEDVLATAVLAGGWPADRAVAALLAVAADPATRSPARLSCPGPWWDARTPSTPVSDGGLVGLEARLAETDGRRVALQRQARDELSAEGAPLTRASVVRRAVEILDRDEAACPLLADHVGGGHAGDRAVDDEPQSSSSRRSCVTDGITAARAEAGESVDAAWDLFGRPVMTAADLDAMTAQQRQASFDAAVVTDLDTLPSEVVELARRDARTALARRTGGRGGRGGGPGGGPGGPGGGVVRAS